MPDFYSRPRVGGDLTNSPGVVAVIFLLTPPRGGRLNVRRYSAGLHAISTHAPAWGATRWSHKELPIWTNFYSRPRVGGDSNFSQGPDRHVIQIAEKYTVIQSSCLFGHAIFEKLCR